MIRDLNDKLTSELKKIADKALAFNIEVCKDFGLKVKEILKRRPKKVVKFKKRLSYYKLPSRAKCTRYCDHLFEGLLSGQ